MAPAGVIPTLGLSPTDPATPQTETLAVGQAIQRTPACDDLGSGAQRDGGKQTPQTGVYRPVLCPLQRSTHAPRKPRPWALPPLGRGQGNVEAPRGLRRWPSYKSRQAKTCLALFVPHCFASIPSRPSNSCFLLFSLTRGFSGLLFVRPVFVCLVTFSIPI